MVPIEIQYNIFMYCPVEFLDMFKDVRLYKPWILKERVERHRKKLGIEGSVSVSNIYNSIFDTVNYLCYIDYNNFSYTKQILISVNTSVNASVNASVNTSVNASVNTSVYNSLITDKYIIRDIYDFIKDNLHPIILEFEIMLHNRSIIKLIFKAKYIIEILIIRDIGNYTIASIKNARTYADIYTAKLLAIDSLRILTNALTNALENRTKQQHHLQHRTQLHLQHRTLHRTQHRTQLHSESKQYDIMVA